MSTSDAPRVVDYAAFRECMAPTVETLRLFTQEVEDVPLRFGRLPSASSQAMAEIATEAKDFAKRTSWTTPITDTHSFGAMTLLAASDYVRTYADAIDADRTPVYGHLVVARSALEACVISAWLNEPAIQPAERVKRGLCEQLYNGMELVRLNIEDDARERVDTWKAVAAGFDWSVEKDRDKPVVDGVKRPSIPAGIAALLVNEPESRIGRVQWSYLSAVSHVTWYGLRQALPDQLEEQHLAGPPLAPVGTTSSSVTMQAVCVLIALRKTATSRFALMGWDDPKWRAACDRAKAHESALLSALQPKPPS